MTPEEEVRADLADELFGNARDFLNQGLVFLLSHPANDKAAKFLIVNLQMSLELLIKWHLVTNVGTQAIFEKPLAGIADLRKRIWAGELRSKDYNPLKQQFISLNQNRLQPPDIELLKKFQTYRNRIVHAFMSLTHEQSVILAIDMAFKVMRRIIGDDPHAPFTGYIDKELYKKLMGYKPYIEKSEEEAEQWSEDDVLLCWECKHQSLAEIHQYYYCFCCGISVPDDAIGYVKCPFCDEKAFAYDTLNVKDHGTTGRCLNCDEDASVDVCVHCDAPVFVELGGRHGKKGWYCELCESLADEV